MWTLSALSDSRLSLTIRIMRKRGRRGPYPLQAMDCPVSWCDREPTGHVANGVHQGVLFSAITSEPWRSGNVVFQVVAKGRLEDAAVLGVTLITEDLLQLSGVLTWEQVRRLRETLEEAEKRLGSEDYEALYPGHEEPGETLREAMTDIVADSHGPGGGY